MTIEELEKRYYLLLHIAIGLYSKDDKVNEAIEALVLEDEDNINKIYRKHRIASALTKKAKEVFDEENNSDKELH